jgi:endonuclease YncB( thermonuclease family)
MSHNLFGFNLNKFELISCYDGDTCNFNILDDNFPTYLNPMLIRVYGVDTPEMKGKNTNKELAIKAKNFTTNFVKNATNLQLIDCIKDKYFRFNCTYISGKLSLADQLIKEKLGKPYFGGNKKDF